MIKEQNAKKNVAIPVDVIGGGSALTTEKVAGKVMTIAPYKITDHAVIAKLWEKIKIETGGNDGPDIGSFDSSLGVVRFSGSEWFRVAMRALDKQDFKGFISVEAMAFPTFYGYDYLVMHTRKYLEKLIRDGEKVELIPLVDTRDGYGDPWTDGRFPTDMPNAESRILPETCIWVKCPECKGKGGSEVSQKAGTKRVAKTCPSCKGSGMTGIYICDRCHGKGQVIYEKQQYEDVFVECENCGGSGKVRSVLAALEIYNNRGFKDFMFVPVPDGTIPQCVIQDELSLPNIEDWEHAYGWQALTKISRTDGRIMLSDDRLKLNELGSLAERVKKEVNQIYEQVTIPNAHYLAEKILIGHCPRYVRFSLSFFVNVNRDWSHKDFKERSQKIRTTGCAPKGYFTPSDKKVAEMTIWLDTLTGKTWGASKTIWDDISYGFEANKKSEFGRSCWGFAELLCVMGKSTGVERPAISEKQKKTKRRTYGKILAKAIFGILWRLVFATGVGALFWWWLEGLNTAVLPSMLEQVKGITGGISENLKLALMVSGGTFVVTYVLTFILSKISFSFEGVVQVLSSLIGCVPAVVLITSGHWGVGGWMALAIVCAISARFEGKAHESWWRWVLMSIGLWVSGGFGMNGHWIISSIITAFSMGILLKDEK